MELLFYAKTLFLTLQDKLAMLKDYTKRTLPEYFADKIKTIHKRLKFRIKSSLRWADDTTENFIKRLEETNRISIEFDNFARELKEEYETNGKYRLMSKQGEMLDKGVINLGLESYDPNRYIKNEPEYNKYFHKICCRIKKLRIRVHKIAEYFSKKEELTDIESQLISADLVQKLQILIYVILDIPKFKFNDYENEKILEMLKQAIEETKLIEKDHRLMQNVGMEEVNAFDFNAYLEKRNKPRKKYIKNTDPAEIKLCQVSNETKEEIIKKSLEPSVSFNEYALVLKSCEFITQRLDVLHKNQNDLVNIHRAFKEKDAYLEEIKKNSLENLRNQSGEDEEDSNVIDITSLIAAMPEEEEYYENEKESKLLGKNPPFY